MNIQIGKRQLNKDNPHEKQKDSSREVLNSYQNSETNAKMFLRARKSRNRAMNQTMNSILETLVKASAKPAAIDKATPSSALRVKLRLKRPDEQTSYGRSRTRTEAQDKPALQASAATDGAAGGFSSIISRNLNAKSVGRPFTQSAQDSVSLRQRRFK